MAFPYIIGGNTGDTIITAADVSTQSINFFVGGSSNDTSLVTTSGGTMKPFVGIISYSGSIYYLAEVPS
jgi:hypothetical protein